MTTGNDNSLMGQQERHRSPETAMQTPTLKPQAFIFDMDGVLVSSETVHWKAYRDTFASEGIEYPCLLYTSPSPRDRG